MSYIQYFTPSGKKFKNIRANLVFAIQNNVNLYFYNVITIKRLGYIFAEHECTTPGYAWNPTHLYCYKYHTVKKPAENASTECSREDSRSHLFLVIRTRIMHFYSYKKYLVYINKTKLWQSKLSFIPSDIRLNVQGYIFKILYLQFYGIFCAVMIFLREHLVWEPKW